MLGLVTSEAPCHRCDLLAAAGCAVGEAVWPLAGRRRDEPHIGVAGGRSSRRLSRRPFWSTRPMSRACSPMRSYSACSRWVLCETLGQMGYVAFGHAAFFGLGAYAVGLMSTKFGFNFWLMAFLAPLPGAALGVLVGFAAARLGGAYFAIAILDRRGSCAPRWPPTGLISRADRWGFWVTSPPLPWQTLFGWGQAAESYSFC